MTGPLRVVVVVDDPVVPASPPEVPPGRAESGRPPTAVAVADTRAELQWAQTGTQPATPSADDVPRRTYRPREQPRSRLALLAVATVVVLASSVVTLSPTWQRVTLTMSPQAPGSSYLDLNVSVSGAPAGTNLYVDDVVLNFQ